MLQNREAAAQCSGGCDTAEPGVAAASDAAAAAAGCEAATVHAARPSGPASQEAVRDMRNAQPPAQPQMHAGLLAAGTVSATSRHLAASQQSSRDDVKQQHTLLPPPLLQDQAQQQQQQRSPQRSWEDTLPDANQASASPASDSPRDVHADCSSMLANAAMHGDAYRWHVDADPWALAESSWTEAYGHYFNRVRLWLRAFMLACSVQGINYLPASVYTHATACLTATCSLFACPFKQTWLHALGAYRSVASPCL